MPKITKTDDGGWAYKCTCGREMVLYIDGGKRPVRLVKCFDCQEEWEYDTYNDRPDRE